MIEFSGYITGNAQKYYKKKVIKLSLFVIITATVLYIPVIIFVETALPLKGLGITIGIAAPLIFCLGIVLITSKRFIKDILPKRILISNSVIHIELKEESESRMTDEVSAVYDYGDFYEICFKKSKDFKYLCQKDKLTQGTLQEFEALFEEKLVALKE